MSADTNNLPASCKRPPSRAIVAGDNVVMGGTERVVQMFETGLGKRLGQLGSNASRSIRVREESRTKRDLRCTAREELEHVAPCLHATHAAMALDEGACGHIDWNQQARMQTSSAAPAHLPNRSYPS